MSLDIEFLKQVFSPWSEGNECSAVDVLDGILFAATPILHTENMLLN